MRAWHIQPVEENELSVVRTILQVPLTTDTSGLTAWLALRPGHGTVPTVGGAAAMQIHDGVGVVWLDVLPAFRRQGLGRQQWLRLSARARALGIEQLQTWRGISDAAGHRFAAAVGLTPVSDAQLFDIPVDEAIAYFGLWHTRFRRRGSIPAGLVPWHDADLDWGAATRLLAPFFGTGVQHQLGRLVSHGLGPDDWAFAMTLDEALVGAAIGHYDGTVIWADAYAIAPAFRHGWAHMVFKYHWLTAKKARRPALERFRFFAGTQFSDTAKWARRMGARQVEAFVYYGTGRTVPP